MRIAILVPNIGPSAGGLYYSVRAMSVGLSELEGNEVKVFTLGDYPQEVFEHWYPLKPETFPVKGPWAYGYSRPMLPTKN